MSRAAILLKSPPRDPATDVYVKQFSSSGYTTYFIEVLESAFVNEAKVEDIILMGPSAFAGVAITSSRAAEAWIQALQRIDSPGDWSQTPFYVVGEVTAAALKHITTSHPTCFSESLILGATQSGKSESLARFILKDLPSRGSNNGRLLYLTGDKNKDTFHRMMNEGSIGVESLRVYETRAASDLGERIERAVRGIQQTEEKEKPIWIVLFAPSSSDFALPSLCKHFHLPDSNKSYEPIQHTRMTAKLAAIGSTTADFLRSERNFRVDAVASKPTAERLVASIQESDANDNIEWLKS